MALVGFAASRAARASLACFQALAIGPRTRSPPGPGSYMGCAACVAPLEEQLAVRRLLEMLDCWTPERAAVALGECPRLLYVDGFAALYEEAVEALAGLVGASAEDAAFCLSEEPTLLFALPRYRDQLPWRCRDIAELPMEVQNQISFGMRSKWTL